MRQSGTKNYPSHYAIAQAWPQFARDLSEPACFACGWHEWSSRNCRTNQSAWAQSKLDRCHIVAESIGGTLEPRNMLLLCKRCHRESPMTNRRDLMIQWVEGRDSYINWMFRNMRRAMIDFKITESDLVAVGPITMEDLAKKGKEIELDFHPDHVGNGTVHGGMAVARAIIDERLERGRRQQYAALDADIAQFCL